MTIKQSSIRQKEIAERTGFSINTVSLALKDSPRISKKTKRIIMECAEQLNYIPNVVARSLVQKKTQTIGIILTDLMNPILTETAQEIEQALKEAGYNLFLMTTSHDPEQEAKALDALVSRQVDGIMMYPTARENFAKIKELHDRNYPIVLLASGNYAAPTDSVFVDRKRGAYEAVTHLLRLGHKRIGYIRFSRPNEEAKLYGYREALEEHGIAYDPEMVISRQGFDSYQLGFEAMEHLYKMFRPSAVLCSMDYLALGAMRWCRQQGLSIPGDVALVGFDDVFASRFAEIPLTSVKYNVKAVTQKAIELLLQRIERREEISRLPLQEIAIAPVLVIRDTCGANKADTGKGENN